MFDNSVAIATFDDATSELRFDSTVTLEHLETALPDYALETEAQNLSVRYSDDDAPDLVRGAAFVTTRATRSADGRARFLSPTGSTDTMALLEAMTLGIRNEFAYVRRPEKGVQRPEETLRLRSGSCRDFALFMMEAVRSLGLAARFVSGYIFVPETRPDRHGRRRRDPRVDAGVSAGRRLGRFRSHQQHRRQPQSDSGRRRLGSRPGVAALGHLHRRRLVVPRHGRQRQRHRERELETWGLDARFRIQALFGRARTLRLPSQELRTKSAVSALTPRRPFRERAARAGLQILLEANGVAFSREFNRNHDRPRPMFQREPGRSAIMPVQSFVDVAGDPDIVSGGIGLTPKYVHEPPSDSTHALTATQNRSQGTQARFPRKHRTPGPPYAVSAHRRSLACDRGEVRLRPPELRSSFGETDFA